MVFAGRPFASREGPFGADRRPRLGRLHRDGEVELLEGFVIGGAVEGTVLGAAQASVLRGVLPGLRPRRWIGGTAIAAAVAWLIGQSLGEAAPGLAERSLPLLIVLAALGAPVLLVSIGLAQWIELRRHAERASRWILGSAAAWLVGLAVFFAVASPL